MHPYISQRLIEAMIDDRLRQAAAARRARQARITAHTTSSRTVSHRPAPIEATIPAQRVPVGAVRRGHGATATEADRQQELCGSGR